MSIFEYINAAILLILGIGVTQLLSDCVDAFRNRQRYRFHWIPLAWAGIVFAWQMQFIWAIYELQSLEESWSRGEFLIMLILAMLLFVAGSLVVPKATDEARDALEQFQQDGRWTLVILAVYFLLAYGANVMMFEIGYFDLSNLDDLILSGFLFFVVSSKKQKTWEIATIVFALMSVVAIIQLSPSVYD